MVRSGAGQGPDGGVRRTRAARAAARSSPLARAPAAPPASPCSALLSVLLINVKEERERERKKTSNYIYGVLRVCLNLLMVQKLNRNYPTPNK